MNRPKISVIVPVYNTEKYIARAIDSILAQTFQDFEILCVNDGSKDSSLQILKQYADKYENIHVIDTENGGVSRARNLGLEQAKGKYVAFVDADDMIEPQMLEFLFRAAEEHPGCIAMCNYAERTEMTNERFTYDCEPISMDKVFPILGDTALLGLSVGNKLFPVSVLEGISFPVGIATHEDVYFSCVACAKADRVIYINRIFYDYFPNTSSVTRVRFNQKHLTAIDALSKCALVLRDIQTENAEYILQFCLTKLYKTILSLRLASKSKENSTREIEKNARQKCRSAFYGHLGDLLGNKGIHSKIKLAMLLFWFFPFTYKAFRKKSDGTI